MALMTNKNDTEDVDLTFDLISKVKTLQSKNCTVDYVLTSNILCTKIIREIIFYRTVNFPPVA